jgi:hypothetical protein
MVSPLHVTAYIISVLSDEAKIEFLTKEVKQAQNAAGRVISEERFLLKGELLDEQRKVKKAIEERDTLSKTIAQLNDSIVSSIFTCFSSCMFSSARNKIQERLMFC